MTAVCQLFAQADHIDLTLAQVRDPKLEAMRLIFSSHW
jgi:hypothetical protein